MKNIIVIMLLGFLTTGCVSAYKAVENGRRAKLNFVSPNLESTFLHDTDLDLIIYEAKPSCSMKTMGKLRLNPGDESISTYIRAGQDGYFFTRFKRVLPGIGWFNSSLNFAFYIEDGAEYSITHRERKGQHYFDYFKHDQNNRLVPIDAKFWSDCKKS